MQTIAKNDLIEIVAGASTDPRGKVLMHQTALPDPRATFAQEMIRNWSLAFSGPASEGEPSDEHGLALVPPAEVVQRACDIAALAFAEFEERGWLLPIPDYADLASGITETVETRTASTGGAASRPAGSGSNGPSARGKASASAGARPGH